MEVLLWFWKWDTRLLYNLNHPANPFVLANLWCLPLALGIIMIILQAQLDEEPKEIGQFCSLVWNEKVAKSRQFYNVVLYIQ